MNLSRPRFKDANVFFGKTPEIGIPPSDRATRWYTKVHLDFCLRFSTLIGQIGRVPIFGAGPRRYIRSRPFRLAVTVFWRAFTVLEAKRQAKAGLSSGHSHDRIAFESFAPDISEQPDPNLADLFDTRNHGSQRLSARYRHTRDVVVTRTHTYTTRDKGSKAPTVPRRPAVRPNKHCCCCVVTKCRVVFFYPCLLYTSPSPRD